LIPHVSFVISVGYEMFFAAKFRWSAIYGITSGSHDPEGGIQNTGKI
jgi:hypothetical protein